MPVDKCDSSLLVSLHHLQGVLEILRARAVLRKKQIFSRGVAIPTGHHFLIVGIFGRITTPLQDKCIVECMDSQLHGQVPSVINCKYQKFQTDFTKVTCNEATLIAACAMPDPAFSGDYYFSDAIEMYQAKFSPTYTIQRNGRNITNPVTTAEAMFEPGWTHQNAYNVTVMKIMHSIFFTDAGDKPAYWVLLHFFS